ncbi:MAG: M36 family metallopeptidase [Pyrinomonadaceae bacterium]
MLSGNGSLQEAWSLRWPLAIMLAVVALVLFQPSRALGQAKILDVHDKEPDFDARAGSISPTAAQAAIVSNLGADVRWNRFGTPHSLIKHGGFLATGLTGDAPTAARNWIRANRALFRLSDQSVTKLELLNDSKMRGSDGHAVIFRQRFGNLQAAQDGMITVGITGGKVVYVSSSAVGDDTAALTAVADQAAMETMSANGDAETDAAAAPSVTLSPSNAWRKSATDIGRIILPNAISGLRRDQSWTLFNVQGFSHPQRARLVAFPTPASGIRMAYETIVLDVKGGNATAYTHFVDAQTGQVLFRQNRVYQLAATKPAPMPPMSQTFTGAFQEAPLPPACGPMHPFNVPAGTQTIDVVATAAVITNDIVLKLFDPGGIVVASSDTATSPEAIHYAPVVVVPGVYKVQVCPFEPPMVPHEPPYNYVGTFTTNDTATASVPYPPKWKFFKANPLLTYANTDTRVLACWEAKINGVNVPGCQLELKNLAARAPWDYDTRTNTPTFTTRGNQARSAEAWLSPLTPAEQYMPVSPTREYTFPWKNIWKTMKCSPTALIAAGDRNDVDAAATNLFSEHNRMHDWSYFLGFTESNFNLQDNNFGNTAPGAYPLGRELDSEFGNVQAGAVDGGAPSYLGRDNANQITLNDGVPGITNMYLWQPIAGAFYPQCVDGDFDQSVIGHEYTHAISNRMVGGPDANLTGHQAGSMGESWSDLNAVEYLNEYKFVPTSGENPFTVGAYVTGDKSEGIRNYNMSANPLNYSDVGYDVGGPEVHSDAEIWDGTNFDIRQSLIDKYNASFPSTNATLQKNCADGKLPAELCPGNRRWIQIVYDAWLLMQPAVSMLDARDAYLAADMMRFSGANQKELWKAFAKRGMGEFASSNTNDDTDPKPNFESKAETNEARITFRALSLEGHATLKAKIYVGKYEARAVPVADTDNATPLPALAKFVPGTYDFIAQAEGYGLFRFSLTLNANQATTFFVRMPTNFASKKNGATAAGDGNNEINLIDDTENTNWASLGTPVAGKQVTVKLGGGGVKTINRVQVSAMLRAADANDPDDSGSQSRFSALRGFEVYACNQSAVNPNCINPLGFTKIFTSPVDAFPGTNPRPGAPDLILRSFAVPATQATHLQLRVVTNQCTGGPKFQGDQDDDPLNDSDCQSGSAQDDNVRAAEFQAFGNAGSVGLAADPVVLMTMTAPSTILPGGLITYQINYNNLGPADSQGAKITDLLPAGVTFVSATGGGVYNAATRKVTWNLGTVGLGTGAVSLTVRVPLTATLGTAIVNQAEFTGVLTVSPPTAGAVTTVFR